MPRPRVWARRWADRVDPFPLGGEQVPAIAVRGHRDDADDRHTETDDDEHRNDQESHVTRVTHVTCVTQTFGRPVAQPARRRDSRPVAARPGAAAPTTPRGYAVRRALLVGDVAQPLGHDRRHAVAAHADAVEGVGDLHRLLLVRDDDELRAVAQLLEEGDEAAEVGVVERRLDLVHDVEGRGPRLEDRDEQRHRDERALATGEQREPLDLLARRPGLDLEAGRQHVGRVGEHEPSLAAGEEPLEDALELHRRVLERLGEDLLDPLVDLLDDVEQVALAVLAGPRAAR